MKNYEINTYSQLVKELVLVNPLNGSGLHNILSSLDFSEEEGYSYNNLDIVAQYIQLKIVEDSDVFVKVVKLTQADNFVLIIPQNVIETHLLIEEDLEIVDAVNQNIDLYAEIYGFDDKDPELLKLIKLAYINVGNRLLPYELVVKKDAEDKIEDNQDEVEDDFGLGGFDDFENDAGAFEEFLNTEDMTANEESFKLFQGDKTSFVSLLNKLNKETPYLAKENITVKQHHNLLIIKVNNKNIYESASGLPKVAKKIISNTGELISQNENTQLIDSISFNKERYFIVAEANNNNFWTTKEDTLNIVGPRQSYIRPIKKDVIDLAKSNVRVETRKYRPALDNNKNLVFIKRGR